MIVFGLLFVLVAVGATLFVVLAPTTTSQVIELTALGVTVKTSPLAIFLTGAVSVALIVLGYGLINGGTRRKAKARKELRHLRKEQAAADASTSADTGERLSRSDRRNKDGAHTSSSKTSTDTADTADRADSTDSTDSTDAGTDGSSEGSKEGR